MSYTEVLCTKNDFEYARSLILKHLEKVGVETRRRFTDFKYMGLSYEAIDLAMRDLIAQGIVEELYSLPTIRSNPGQRKIWVGLVTALDLGQAEVPEGTMRLSEALKLIADKVTA